MAELFTMNSSLKEILENERVNKKLNYLFSSLYYSNVRPMFKKMKLKHMVRFVKTPWGRPFPAEGLLRCANFLLERREKGELISIPIWQGLEEHEMVQREKVVLVPFMEEERKNAQPGLSGIYFKLQSLSGSVSETSAGFDPRHSVCTKKS